MNKWLFILIIIGVVFLIGKFFYDNYGQNVRSVLNLPNISNNNAAQGDYNLGNNPNGLQASSIQRNSATQ